MAEEATELRPMGPSAAVPINLLRRFDPLGIRRHRRGGGPVSTLSAIPEHEQLPLTNEDTYDSAATASTIEGEGSCTSNPGSTSRSKVGLFTSFHGSDDRSGKNKMEKTLFEDSWFGGVFRDFRSFDASPKFVLFWLVMNVMASYFFLQFAWFMGGHLASYESQIHAFCNPLHMSADVCIGDMWTPSFQDNVSLVLPPTDPDADFIISNQANFRFSTHSRPATYLLSVEPTNALAQKINYEFQAVIAQFCHIKFRFNIY